MAVICLVSATVDHACADRWNWPSRIAGVLPGRRLSIHGAAAPRRPGGPLVFYNPQYELLQKDG